MKTINNERSGGSFHCYWFVIVVVFFSCMLLNKMPQAADCLFAIQLREDPQVRSEYEAAIAAGRTSGMSLNGMLDPLAIQCLTCHDGTLASGVRYRISEGNFYQIKSIETIKGAHPVGMNYEKASANREFEAAETLPADMVLMYGSVGCVTCHNLLGNNTFYHPVDNATSGLCFSCHRK